MQSFDSFAVDTVCFFPPEVALLSTESFSLIDTSATIPVSKLDETGSRACFGREMQQYGLKTHRERPRPCRSKSRRLERRQNDSSHSQSARTKHSSFPIRVNQNVVFPPYNWRILDKKGIGSIRVGCLSIATIQGQARSLCIPHTRIDPFPDRPFGA